MLPNFLVIGAPRAGTTWIHHNLRQHPDIYMPGRKELHFFDRHYDKGIDYYTSFFEGRKDEAAAGEATPAYLHGLNTDRNIPALIKADLPDAMLIASLRNPVDRLYSHYWNVKSKFPENADLSFEEKIAQKPSFIEEGFYFDQLQRYFRYFAKDQILILLFDDLESKPMELLHEVYRFLHVDPNFDPGMASRRMNASSSKKLLGKSQILWYLHRGLLRIGMLRLAHFIERMNRREIPPMRRETRKQLVEVYRPKNQELQELIGRDLTHWNWVG